MKYLADQGAGHILIVSGQTHEEEQLDLTLRAIGIAKEFFYSISLEIGTLSESSLSKMTQAGADSFVLYQETFDPDAYARFHTGGIKKDYRLRLDSHDIAARSGFQRCGTGVLLGLSDPVSDLLSLFFQIHHLYSNYRGLQVSVSLPRICTEGIRKDNRFIIVPDSLYVRAIAAFRICFPTLAIYISTRERPKFRDLLIGTGVTHLSAGVSTSAGGYTKQDSRDQFSINDRRSISDIYDVIKTKGYLLSNKDWDLSFNTKEGVTTC